MAVGVSAARVVVETAAVETAAARAAAGSVAMGCAGRHVGELVLARKPEPSGRHPGDGGWYMHAAWRLSRALPTQASTSALIQAAGGGSFVPHGGPAGGATSRETPSARARPPDGGTAPIGEAEGWHLVRKAAKQVAVGGMQQRPTLEVARAAAVMVAAEATVERAVAARAAATVAGCGANRLGLRC
jgi:hypothetical protein